MLDSEVLLNSQTYPPGFRRDFDAHIYYDSPATREQACQLRAQAIETFSENPVFIGQMIDRPVGPHPTPMFEINFSKKLLNRVQDWLSQHRGELTILIHEVTGDDPRDHADGATWLGTPLSLDKRKLTPSANVQASSHK